MKENNSGNSVPKTALLHLLGRLKWRSDSINCQLLSYRFIITNKENKSVFTQLKDRKMYFLCQKLRVHQDTRPPVIFLGYHQSTRAEGQGWGHPLITVML